MTGPVRADDAARIGVFLRRADALFAPPLSRRVDIGRYAEKLARHAVNLFAVDGALDRGHAAIYVNDALGRAAFLSSICVLPEYRSDGVAALLLQACLEQARRHGMGEVRLEVARDNARAIAFYRRHGFEFLGGEAPEAATLGMCRTLAAAAAETEGER